MKKIIWRSLLLWGLFLFGFENTLAAEKFPDFSTIDLDGKPHTQALFQENKLTMINLWGTYCPPCLEEMPFLGEISQEYKDRGLKIVGIVVDSVNNDLSPNSSKASKAKTFVEKTGANYLHLIPAKDMSSYLEKVQYIPDTIFVDKDGNVLGEHYIGSRTKEQWIQIIETHLQEVQ
jgi:thiol-disulfide isomerase/thioredoxin